ncbi:MAG: hypothetical protein U0169_16650 [Polyangiaceae bacterium]
MTSRLRTAVGGSGIALAATLAVPWASLSACNDGPTVHTYAGRPYDVANDCLGTSGVLDILDGPAAETGSSTTCDAVCLVGPAASDGGTEVYVSAQCPPFPPGFDAQGSDARCTAARDAFANKKFCKS